MPTPFPGMDPYLERDYLWEQMHTGLMVAISDELNPQIRPRYLVRIQHCTYLIAEDDEVTDRYLELYDVKTGEIITQIEILLARHKVEGEGKWQFDQRQHKARENKIPIVGIDLIRDKVPNYGVYILDPDRTHLKGYVFGVREPIPDIPIPLRRGEPDLALPLNRLLHDRYDRSNYDLAIDYSQPPEPPLSDEDNEWAAELLRAQGLRD
jgi:hypothetical protein